MPHTFNNKLTWTKKDFENNLVNRKIYKNHFIEYPNHISLQFSAAKTFKGDDALLNPEDMLLSSIQSCHMMSFIYICSKYQLILEEYHSKGEAKLEVYEDGSGKIVAVTLEPKTVFNENVEYSKLLSLHQEAHQLCFIANSCNFPIIINPVINS